MNVVGISGTLIAGPPQISDSAFPSGVTNISFALNPPQKQAALQTGAQVKNLNSPSAYVTLDGVGTDETITQGNTFYLRVANPILLRLTFKASSGPDITSVIPVKGLFILEADDTQYLKLIEAQGSGPVEYYVSGNL